jgi:hypothetical protein
VPTEKRKPEREQEIRAASAGQGGRAGVRVRVIKLEGVRKAKRAGERRMRARVMVREREGGSRERGARMTEECEMRE